MIWSPSPRSLKYVQTGRYKSPEEVPMTQNANNVPVVEKYIPSSAMVTLTAVDFHGLVQQAEEAVQIKDQLIARYHFFVDTPSWSVKSRISCTLKPLPIAHIIGQAVATQLLADPDMMYILARDDDHFFCPHDGSFSSYAGNDDNYIDLLDFPEFRTGFEAAQEEADYYEQADEVKVK